MSSWRPGRSPSPPYRSRRYSPSREVSPPPPRRNDENHYRPNTDTTARPISMRPEHYSPPPARPRSRSPPRYREERYRENSPPRRYRSPTPPRAIPPPRRRPGAADFYDDPPIAREVERRPMVADREEIRQREIPPPRQAKVEEQWERGQEVQADYGYEHGPGQDQHLYGEEHYEDERTRKGGKGPSQPFRDVIFLGLDEELTEDDFAAFLKTEHGANINSVKIVRDRVTGKSKNFGFAQFTSVEDAEDFVLPNFPYITMPALYAHSEAQKVKIDFSTPLGTSNPSGPDTQQLEPARRHDGTRHIGQPGGGKRVLLFRMLDWNTRGDEIIWRTSQEIARLLNKVGREKEAEGCIVRAATIQDKAGRGASWGFAFVELVTSELAAALLSFLLSPQSQPHGFLIANRPIATSFADPASFEATEAGLLGGQYLLRATANGGIGSETKDKSEGGWCTYANEQAGAIETIPGKSKIPDDGILPEMTPQMRSFLGVYAGKVDQVEEKAPVAPVGMINIANVMQPIKIGTGFAIGSIGKGKKEEGIAGPSRKNLFDDEDEVDTVGKDTVLLSRTKGAHIVPPTSGSRKIAKNISKWNTKQSELASRDPGLLKGISSANAVSGSKPIPQASSSSVQQRPTPVASTSAHTSTPKPQSPVISDDYDYSDVQASGKVACLLCQRALPSAEVMRKHVLTSDLHKTNLANPATVEAGKKRKAAALAKSTTVEEPKYRDRAAERREVFNQPEKPHYLDRVALSIPQGPPKRKFVEGPKEPSPPPEPGLAPGMDESNKGNALLAKMGWAAGTGLGKEKEGRVEPIEVKLLGERAGLGAKR